MSESDLYPSAAKLAGLVDPGNYADFIYWGPSSTAAGVNKKAVNWDGYNKISLQNYRTPRTATARATHTTRALSPNIPTRPSPLRRSKNSSPCAMPATGPCH